MTQLTRVTPKNVADLGLVMSQTEALKQSYVLIDEWIVDPRNIALKINGSYGVFEWEAPHRYCGHYFFRARGKEALATAKTMLKEMFTVYKAKVIVGLTPTDHKAALWMNRQLSFTKYHEFPSEAGPHYVFVLTADEWNSKQ